MNELLCDFQNLSCSTNETVCHDVGVILESWGLRQETLDVSKLRALPGEFESTHALYEEVIQVLIRGRCCLMELMPYVDDYLEWYAGRCGPFNF